ncbi:phytanoyl-CoA dioxygenase family protein [Kiloniella majae]|uniref:phytanoyl-CoA dioxygenase family protein n=1 Tax=Kiloniella majae TaxID=1938558 RepID=UPI001302573F|nr:phytanoyl-CoA dioxygenase family protein [Kiloniella majae]
MGKKLTPEQINAYEEQGYLLPLDLFSLQEAFDYRQEIEDLETQYRDGVGEYPLNQFFRINGQIVIPLLAQIAQTPKLLDAVEDILGPDLLVWSCELFIKEAGTAKTVSWHQDLTYWGMGETDDEVTAWIAFSDVSKAAGCMRFIPGSHKQRIVPHQDTFNEDNLLSRGQEIAVDVNEEDAVYDELRPGQMSLHHGRLFHASGPNKSDDRRIGMAIRFVTPGVEHNNEKKDFGMLVRGSDKKGNWINVSTPSQLFGTNELRLYDEILAKQSSTLTAGAEQTVGLYTK